MNTSVKPYTYKKAEHHNHIREGGKLRKNGGAHSTLDISLVNVGMEFCFFVCVRFD